MRRCLRQHPNAKAKRDAHSDKSMGHELVSAPAFCRQFSLEWSSRKLRKSRASCPADAFSDLDKWAIRIFVWSSLKASRHASSEPSQGGPAGPDDTRAARAGPVLVVRGLGDRGSDTRDDLSRRLVGELCPAPHAGQFGLANLQEPSSATPNAYASKCACGSEYVLQYRQISTATDAFGIMVNRRSWD